MTRTDHITVFKGAAGSAALARDLLFALARVLSSRLRNTTVRVRR